MERDNIVKLSMEQIHKSILIAVAMYDATDLIIGDGQTLPAMPYVSVLVLDLEGFVGSLMLFGTADERLQSRKGNDSDGKCHFNHAKRVYDAS